MAATTRRTAARTRTTARRSAAKESTAKSTAGKPTAGKSAARKSAAGKPTVAKPAVKKPAVKKPAAKKRAARKSTAVKSAAKQAAARKRGAQQPAARRPSAERTASRTSAAGQPYTRPELRERLKARIMRGTKGGRAGQWSARKAQLLAHEYEAQGGGYRQGVRTPGQRHLAQWTEEGWTTADGQRARRGAETARYLPEQAWRRLSEGERRATERKKLEGSRRGRQHVANTAGARRARRSASAG